MSFRVFRGICWCFVSGLGGVVPFRVFVVWPLHEGRVMTRWLQLPSRASACGAAIALPGCASQRREREHARLLPVRGPHCTQRHLAPPRSHLTPSSRACPFLWLPCLSRLSCLRRWGSSSETRFAQMAPKRRKTPRRLEAAGAGDGDADAAPAGVHPDTPYSNLGTHLLKQWSWGLIPATEVQRVAMAGYKDGLRHPEVVKLASLGQWGHYPGNIHGQLHTILGTNYLPEPAVFPVSCVNPKTSAVTIADCAALLPHEWFSALYHRYNEEFHEMFGVERIGEFWGAARRCFFLFLYCICCVCPGM